MKKDLDFIKNPLWLKVPLAILIATVLTMVFADSECNSWNWSWNWSWIWSWFWSWNWYCKLFGMASKLELIQLHGWILAGCLSAWAVSAADRRSRAMVQDTRQDRFRDAINHLGNKESSSVRQGGFHSLFHLALDDDNLRPSIANILCAHIRETTNSKNYLKDYNTNPSIEIQSFLDLLFKEKTHSRDKREKFWKNLTPDLTRVYLKGVNLYQAQLQGADLSSAQLQGANLEEVQLQGANLENAYLEKTNFKKAQLQGAKLRKAQLQGTDLRKAQLQGADLMEAQLQGADLMEAQLQGADLMEAQLQGASLRKSQLQGADLREAQLQGAVSFEPKDTFRSSILDRVGKDSEFSTVVFAGGVDKQSIEQWISILVKIETFTKEKLQSFEEKMGKHMVPRKIEHNPPDGASTGKFNEEEAEKWITEYDKAMATVPKFIK